MAEDYTTKRRAVAVAKAESGFWVTSQKAQFDPAVKMRYNFTP